MRDNANNFAIIRAAACLNGLKAHKDSARREKLSFPWNKFSAQANNFLILRNNFLTQAKLFEMRSLSPILSKLHQGIWSTLAAGGADAFDDIFRLAGFETVGQGDDRDVDVGKAEGAVAHEAGEVDVASAMVGIALGTDAVFLRACAVVDEMKQMGIGKRGERTEQGGTIDRGKRGLKVGQGEGIAEAVTHLAPDHQAYRRHTDAGIIERLLVGDKGIIHGSFFE